MDHTRGNEDHGPEVALRDVCLPLRTLRTIGADDTPITNHKSENMPPHAADCLGRLRFLLRFLGNADNSDCMVYIQKWCHTGAGGVRPIGGRAMKVTVRLGAANTDAHPVTQAADGTYYEADAFEDVEATLPYEIHRADDMSGCCIVLDVTGAEKISVQADLDGGPGVAITALVVIGRPL